MVKVMFLQFLCFCPEGEGGGQKLKFAPNVMGSPKNLLDFYSHCNPRLFEIRIPFLFSKYVFQVFGRAFQYVAKFGSKCKKKAKSYSILSCETC